MMLALRVLLLAVVVIVSLCHASSLQHHPSARIGCAPPHQSTSCVRAIYSIITPTRGIYTASFQCVDNNNDDLLPPLSITVNGLRKIDDVSLSLSLLLREGINVIEIEKSILTSCTLDVAGAIPPPRAGAAEPYVELEAENATATNGVRIGPSYEFHSVPAEASARQAIVLTAGQWIDFTVPVPSTNVIAIRFAVPDGTSSTLLNVLVDGVVAGIATLTSNYTFYYGQYPFTKDPADGSPHHYFDTVDVWLSPPALAGSTLRLLHPGALPTTPTNCSVFIPEPQRFDCGFNGINESTCLARDCCWIPVSPNPKGVPWCFSAPLPPPPQPAANSITVDLIDLYDVPPPDIQPASSISIIKNGADPTGVIDSTTAITETINQAVEGGVAVWIPPGKFTVTARLSLPSHTTLIGAGPFYSIFRGKDVGLFSPKGASFLHVSSIAIEGDTRIRDDSYADAGIGSGPSNSVFENIHITHTKCGAWIDGPLDGLIISGARIHDTTADGVNFHAGIINSIVMHSTLRNTGDDGLAMWSQIPHADENNTFIYNTIQTPVLANNLAIYGGANNAAVNNLLIDTLTNGGGIHIANRFGSVPLSGVTRIDGNELHRTGQLDPGFKFGVGAVWFWALDAPLNGVVNITNTLVIDSPYEAFQFYGSEITNVYINNATVVNVGTFVFQVQASGSASAANVITTGTQYNGIYNCSASFMIDDLGGNQGWSGINKTHCGFPPQSTPAPIIVRAPLSGFTATWSNVIMRKDIYGTPVNSHSGGLYRFGQLFYLYGTAYQNCTQPGAVCDTSCGFYNNTFVVYSSPDLTQWTLLNDNLVPEINHDSSSIEYDEVNVGFNALSQEFVMSIWSGEDEFRNSIILLARSPTPAGPFTLAAPVKMHGASVISDTISMFVDTDNTAYLRYNTRDLPYRHIVEKLDPTWRNSTGEFAQVFSKQDFPWYDGGGMLKRGVVYYVMLSFDCCFCVWGSDALVFVAGSPLGPWAPQSSTALRTIHQAAAAAAAVTSAHARVAGQDSCSLTGAWAGKLAGQPITEPVIHLVHDLATNAVSVTGAVTTTAQFFPANSSLVFTHFPNYGPVLVGTAGPYNGSTIDCSQITWDPPYSPPGSFWCKWPECAPSPLPPANWTNEVNPCGDGKNPPAHVADMNINPCSQSDVYGTNFTIPAQQFGIAVLRNDSGGDDAVWYFGERFGSSPIGNKSADFQYFGQLHFDAVNGAILPMAFVQEFNVTL